MAVHQLAILMEELFNLQKAYDQLKGNAMGKKRGPSNLSNIEQQLRTVKSKIQTLGTRGDLRVAIVKKKRWHKMITNRVPGGVVGLHIIKNSYWDYFTQVSFWHNLDKPSISQLINNGLKDNEKLEEITIIDIQLGQVFDDSNNFILSWLNN